MILAGDRGMQCLRCLLLVFNLAYHTVLSCLFRHHAPGQQLIILSAVQAQGEILKQYRAGGLNCLVSTSVAEEGLDVRQCQLVVRYDLPSTLLAFIQSRGRARMLTSDMVLLVDRHSLDDLTFLDHALA